MAIALQGGHFDKPDRIFTSIEQAWLSASSMNLQDVRELIPEFFYLPDFLTNKNKFDFGMTQKGDDVCDVQLPVWARNDPIEFIKRNREALESQIVSENLHNWIDLIFGWKQRGIPAEESMNVFIHLTYDGEVDVDAISDPILRDATIAQINNFGQTPTKLFDKPHPKKTVPDLLRRTPTDILAVDGPALQWHEQSVLTPPLCIAGAPHLTAHTRISYALATYPTVCGPRTIPGVGDIQLFSKDKMLCVPFFCHFLSPSTGSKKVIQYGGLAGGISIHSAAASTRNSTLDDREGTYHERLHDGPVTCVSAGRVGTKDILATGSEDGSIRLWGTQHLTDKHRVEHLHTLVGHSGTVLCIDLSASHHVVLSGSADRTAALWDVRAGKLLRVLCEHENPVISVSVNAVSGDTLTLSCFELRIHTLNGDMLGSARMGMDIMKSPTFPPTFPPAMSPSLSFSFSTAAAAAQKRRETSDSPPLRLKNPKPSQPPSPPLITRGCVVLAPPCSAWHDGVVAVTGHESGLVCFWRFQSTVLDVNGKKTLLAIPLTLSTAQHQSQKRGSGQLQSHTGAITVLRYHHIASPAKPKDFSEKNSIGGGIDLLIGDGKGYVSVWTVQKLENFSPTELGQLPCLRPPPSRETPLLSGSGAVTALGGSVNAFNPLGASGLLKMLGAGVKGSHSHSHSQSSHTQHETASALSARVQEIEDLSYEDTMEEFF